MKKVSIRKRLKETSALLLSALMVFATVGMPLQTVAESYSYGNPDQYPDSGLFMEGDTLATTDGNDYNVVLVSFDKTGGQELTPSGGTFVTAGYYTGPATYTFPHEDAIFHEETIDNRLKTVYELISEDDTANGRSLKFATYYGIQVEYLNSDGEVNRLDYTYYYVSDDNNLEEEFSSPGSLDDDEDLGEFIGWSTNPDYVDETSDGLYFEPEDGVTFDLIMDYVSDGVLVLYPIYHKETFTSTMTVEMADYKAADARSVTNPAPEGYAGTDRTFSWEYFKTDAEGTVTDDTPVSTTPPADPGYYQVVVTAATKDEIPEETASANFKVTGTQSITFNPDGVEVYLGALGNTVLIPDLVEGIEEDAELHFQIITGNSDTYSQDMYVTDREYPNGKVRIMLSATDLYDAYTEEFDFPITYLPWPEEPCTLEGDLVEGVEVNGYPVYRGPVTVKAPEGFKIINDYDIRNHDGKDYPRGNLCRISDEALTSWADYSGEIWIDLDNPKVMDGTLIVDEAESEETLTETASFTAKTVEFVVYDGHYDEYTVEWGDDVKTIITSFPTLKSVTVDGVEVPTDTEYPGAKTHVKLTNNLPVSKTFTVVATDIADHETTWSITLSPDLGDTPNPAYIINGTEGNNGYYTSDVTLKAPTGYTISADDDDPDSYAEEIDYDETITQIRLKNTETGKYTDLVDVEEIMIDKDAPEITLFDGDEAVTPVNGKITLSGNDGLYIHAEDGNSGLLSATVNGKGLTIVDGTDARIQIYEDKTDREVVITVEDNAGNTDTLTFTLVAGTATAEGELEAVLNLVYDGTAKNLVVAKNVQNGTMMYSDTEDGYYTETVPSGTIATTYTIWYKVVGNEAVDPADGVTASKGYLDTEPASIEVTIAPLTAVLSWDDTEFEYDGEEHCPTAVVSNPVGGDTCNVTVSGAQTDAGDYTATATELSNTNYALPEEKTTSFTIRKRSAYLNVDPTAKTLTYDGTEQQLVTPGSATEGGKMVYCLDEAADFTETIPTAKAAGTYKVGYKAVAENDNYLITPEVYGEIDVVISPLTATLEWDDTEFDYDGEEHCPTAVVSNLVSGDTCDVTVTGAQTNAGSHTATATTLSNANYILPEENEATFTIGKAAVSVDVAPTAKTLTYDGTEQALVTIGSATEGGKIVYRLDGTDTEYTDSIPAAKAAGTYSVSYKAVTTSGNYEITTDTTETLEVVISPLAATLGWNNTEFGYDGEEHCPTAVVNNLVSGDTCDVTVTGAQTNAGSYTATATGLSNSNYALPETNTTSFTIGKAVASIDVVPTANTLTYNGTEQALVSSGSATEGGKIVYRLDGTDTEYTDSIPAAKAAGTYKVFYKAVPTSNNYEITPEIAGMVEVVISPLTALIVWENRAFVYDGNAHCIKGVVSNLVSGDTCNVTVTGAQTDAGSYTATATAVSNANYVLPEGGSSSGFSIIRASAHIEEVPEAKTLTYDGTEQELVTSGTVTKGAKMVYRLGGDDALFTETIPVAKNAGTYSVAYKAVAENDNYVITPETAGILEVVISPAVVSVATIPTAKTLTYDGTEKQLLTPGSATEGGKLVYRLEGGEYSDTVPVGKKAGEYKVYFKPVATDDNHESKSEEAQTTVTIAPKTLTVSWSDTTFTYDGKEHKPSATIGGICGTDNVIATVTGAKTAVGTYTATVSVSGTDASNYKLPENTSAEYTIKAKPADPVTPEKKAGSATVSMGSFVFGGKSTTPVVSSSTNDATKASISYKPSGAGDDAYTGSIPSAAGSYTVRAILPENDNYKGCVVYGSFTISYLEVPDGAYVLKGTVGNSDWYTSEVQLKPGDGYEISVGDRNSFSAASITLTEEMAGKTFFVRKKDTGEQSAGIKLMSLKIDTDSPELVDMEENGIYYGNDSNQLLGTAKDKNLYKVYVDGREVTTSTDENGNVIFELPLGKKREPVSVRIVDEAGNEKKISLTTAPGWMRSGEVGEGEYYLELGYAYKMPKNGSGLYVAGRPTRFMPGVTFFAKKEGSTEFEK